MHDDFNVQYLEKYQGVINDLKREIKNRANSIDRCEAVLNDSNISLDPTTVDNLKSVIEKSKEVVESISNILKKYKEV